MRPAYLIILIILNFFWAAALSAYKVIEPNLQPGGIVTLRFGLAAVSLLILWPWLPGFAPRGRDFAKTCALGLIVVVLGHRLQVLGNKLSSASNSSILMAVEPLVAAVAAAIFLHEHIGPRRMVGFACGLLGVVLLNGVWRADFKWISLGASLIFISSFVCEAAYSIVGKKIIQRAGSVKVLAISLTVGTVANLLIDGPTTLAAASRMPVQAWLLVLGLALICTAFGYSFWFLVIREGEVNVAALTIFLQPVFGVALAKLWLGETLHWGQLWGSAAIVIGIVIGLSRQVRTAAHETA
jgi:drug/metabolite transporter (DMT)-like permease